MIYNDADQRAEEMMLAFDGKKINFRMARVTEVLDGRPKIQFYGETQSSQKMYKYLQSFNAPQAGDTVLMARVGNSYVILGKVV